MKLAIQFSAKKDPGVLGRVRQWAFRPNPEASSLVSASGMHGGRFRRECGVNIGSSQSGHPEKLYVEDLFGCLASVCAGPSSVVCLEGQI